MPLEQLGLYSTLIGAGAYALLVFYLIGGLLRRVTGRALLFAGAATGVATAAPLDPTFATYVPLLYVVSYGAWFLVVLRVLGVGRGTWRDPEYARQVRMFYVALALVGLGLTVATIGIILPATEQPHTSIEGLRLGSRLLLAVMGLVLVEQLFRNTRRDYQWNMKFMSLGLVLIFGYEFILYADAVLFSVLNETLRTLRPIAHALAVPFIIIASGRNRHNALNVNLSREFVFRSGVLFATGTYLLLMAAGGYYLRLFGGSWGDVILVLFIIVALAGLAVLAGSSSARNYLRVVIDRNLFEYKYDYRAEWRRITNTLTRPDADLSLGQRVIVSLADVLHVKEGAVWLREDNGLLLPYAHYHVDWNFHFSPADTAAIAQFFSEREWIVDLDELRRDQDAYVGLPLSERIANDRDIRFIVPLFINDQISGIVLLGQPSIALSLIWEDYDLLKVSARQAASVIAQHRAAQALANSRQFEAFHQMSAFVVHDIKTVVAQLSLLVRNAERHKTNPKFIEDMLATTDNAAKRMQKLLDQLRDPKPQQDANVVDVTLAVRRATERLARGRPVPQLQIEAPTVQARAQEEQLISVIGHVIQNAQDATPDDGSIKILVDSDGVWAVISITDTGSGMDEAFVRDRLFSPFDSTKGVTGMGIGVYQSREYLRSQGGDLRVSSMSGQGSSFVLTLPLASVDSGTRSATARGTPR